MSKTPYFIQGWKFSNRNKVCLQNILSANYISPIVTCAIYYQYNSNSSGKCAWWPCTLMDDRETGFHVHPVDNTSCVALRKQSCRYNIGSRCCHAYTLVIDLSQQSFPMKLNFFKVPIKFDLCKSCTMADIIGMQKLNRCICTQGTRSYHPWLCTTYCGRHNSSESGISHAKLTLCCHASWPACTYL